MNEEAIQKLVKMHQSYLTFRKEISPLTLQQYEYVVKKYLEPLESVFSIDGHSIRKFLSDSDERVIKLSTRYAQYYTLRSFCRAMIDAEIIPEKTLKDLDKFKIPKIGFSPQDALTKEEIKKLRIATELTKFPERNLLLLDMFIETGVRVHEGLAIQVEDVSAELIVFIRKRKGKKTLSKEQSIVFITEATYDKFFDLVGKFKLMPGERIFPITRSQVWKILKRLAFVAGLKKKVTPHTLRHTWFTIYYKATKDLIGGQILGGWLGLEMPRRYAHVDVEFLRKEHEKAFPSSSPESS